MHFKSFVRLGLLILLCSLAGAIGCKTNPAAPAVAQEQSVRPGANAEYLKPDLNVDQWVERFEKGGREIYDHRQEIVRAAKIRPGSAVADIGAGTGLFEPLLAQAVGAAGKVYAVDIVPKFLDHIRERANKAGLHNVETVLATDRSVQLPANSVDLVFICDVYHHFEYPQSELASIHRALRRGGQIFLIEFKREPGQSSAWTLQHVRAGQETFTHEIESAGFQKTEDIPLLRENYILRFRKN